MLQPLLDNATRYGRSVVNVRVDRSNTVASIAVDDDGPGVAGDERDTIFEPGNAGALRWAMTARDSGSLSLSASRGAQGPTFPSLRARRSGGG